MSDQSAFENWWNYQGRVQAEAQGASKEQARAAWLAAMERAETLCMDESVDEGTGEPTDGAYNQACADCADAIKREREG